MFDIGFWELALISVIALLVVGPERLPGLARTVGLWVGRIRRYVSHVKQDIERELHAEEVRRLLDQPDGLEGIRDVARETASVLEDTRKELNDMARTADADTAPESAPGSGPTETAGTDQSSGAVETTQPAAPSVPHHAVDDDPFASGDTASGASPAGAAGAPQAPAPQGGSSIQEPSIQAPSTQEHEQQPERQGQR